jgi:hypothetical protein
VLSSPDRLLVDLLGLWQLQLAGQAAFGCQSEADRELDQRNNNNKKNEPTVSKKALEERMRKRCVTVRIEIRKRWSLDGVEELSNNENFVNGGIVVEKLLN